MKTSYTAFCPHPTYDQRHEYKTLVEDKQGGTWLCEEHSPERMSKTLLNYWMKQLLFGDLEDAIARNAPLQHRIYLAREYQKAERGEF